MISLSGGAPQFQKLPEMLQFGGLVAVANTSLALLAVSIMWIDPNMLWLLAVPLAVVFLAYRSWVSEREKHERLELLYQSSRILQHSPELDSALVALLDHARDMFRAERAEVILYPRGADGDVLRTTSNHEAPAETMVPMFDAASDPIQRRAAVEGGPFFYVPASGRGSTGQPLRQAMVSPLRGESGLIGRMIIANRLTEGTSFADDDLRLLETLANQAAVALENGQLEQSLAELSRLKEQLRHQAYHDPLTGPGQPDPVRRAGQPPARQPARWPPCRSSCSSTSTTSRWSTTRWATRPATGCSSPSPTGSAPVSVPRTWRPASAATSSPSSSRTTRA